MPYKKNKKRKDNLKQKQLMTPILMTISLKTDDYIYKNKPIPVQEAEKYARELRSFGKHCDDERYLQVIEKLSSYMKHIINEQSSKNSIVNTPRLKPIEDLNADTENAESTRLEYSIVETERTISNLSIVDQEPKNSRDINMKGNPILAPKEYSSDTIKKNSTITKHKDITNKIIDSNNMNKQIRYANAKLQNDKDIIVDRSNNSQNILRNFEYGTGSLGVHQNTYTNDNRIKQLKTVKNDGDIAGKLYCPDLSEKVQVKNKEIADDNSKQSQNILSNFDHDIYTSLCLLQNTSAKKKPTQQNLKTNNYNEYITKKSDQKNKHSRNVPSNCGCEHDNYVTKGALQTNNTNKKSSQTQKKYMKTQDKVQLTQSRIEDYILKQDIKHKTIVKGKQNIQHKINDKNVTKKAKKKNSLEKSTVNNFLTNWAQVELYKRDVNQRIENVRNFEICEKSGLEKNKRKSSLKKKKEDLSLSWVEDVKYVRVIDKEEYTNLNNLGDTFWSDTSVPPDINFSDFEDNINIWKH